MRLRAAWIPALAISFAACSTTPTAAPTADGLTLSRATRERVAGSYADQGVTVLFDSTKVDDDLFVDLKQPGGFSIIHIETTAETYEFSYMNGKLRMHANKAFVAAQRAQAADAPDAVSTDGFVFDGDTNALDEMMQLPEVALLPHLSRALGAGGYTGMDFPSTLALHKIARQSADGLGIQVEPIEAPASNGYCTAYPNRSNSCYGMCGPGCSCWSWVCGDCCYHHGCAVHDSWCRQGKWYYCYNISAVIALFGC